MQNNQPLSKITIGIIAGTLMVSSGVCASLVQALVKYASQQNIHPFQIAFFRSFLVIPLLSPILITHGIKAFKTKQPKLTLLRAIVGSVAVIFFYYGLSKTEIAKTQALIFLVPIFVSILAIIFLKEIVGKRRWIAMVFGCLGAVVVLNPSIEIGLGPLFILVSCIFWSSSVLILKLLTKTDSNYSLVIWQAIGVLPATLLISIPVWTWPDFEQLLLLFSIAVFGTLTHFMLNAALKRERVSFLLPLDYLRLFWSVILGFYVFGEIPSNNIWFGAIIIILSTSYITFRELKLNKSNSNKNLSIT